MLKDAAGLEADVWRRAASALVAVVVVEEVVVLVAGGSVEMAGGCRSLRADYSEVGEGSGTVEHRSGVVSMSSRAETQRLRDLRWTG